MALLMYECLSIMAGPRFLSVGKITRLLLLRRLERIVFCMGSRLLPVRCVGHCCLSDFRNRSIRIRYSGGISDRGGVHALRMKSLGVGRGELP